MPAPEPPTWRPPEPLLRRIFRGVRYPVLAGGAVFGLAVVVAIALVMFRPHDLPASEAAPPALSESEEQQADLPLPERSADVDVASNDTVFVHVVGEVQSPGVVELPANARVEAAIAAAGGATDAAILSGVNLARIVTDGEQILVPDEETVDQAPTLGDAAHRADATSGDEVVNLNTASASELETLPRIGPALAQRILDWRAAHGRFSSVDDLLQVSGVGAKTLEGFRDRVTV